MVSFLSVLQEVNYPMLECPEVDHSVVILREHFMYRHFQPKVEVVQEGEELLPLCDLYRMHMPMVRIIKHHRTYICEKNTQIRWRRRYVVIVER